MQAAAPATSDHADRRWFATTHWSAVTAAGRGGGESARQALEGLCGDYWRPIYAYVRRTGRTHADAEDLTQSFFARLLEGNCLRAADQSRGRFRSFLLTCLKHHLAHETEKQRAAKRGGDCVWVTLDAASVDFHPPAGVEAEESPEECFDRQWAVTVLRRGLDRLRLEAIANGRLQGHELLVPFLSTEAGPGGYEATAARLGISVNAVAVSVHRLRQRFGAVVREELRRTVMAPNDVEDELRHLIELVRRRGLP